MTAAVRLVPGHPETPRPPARTTTVIPASHPTPPHPMRKVAATIVLGAPAAAAIWGSATALTAIAAEDKVTSPWTLPFCLDVLALGMVVVALLVPGRSFIRRATPWACYGFSAGLQVWEAWELGYRAWGTHAAGLIAAAVGSHVILDLWAPEAGEGAEPAPVVAPRAEVAVERPAATPDAADPEPEPRTAAALTSVPSVRQAATPKPPSPKAITPVATTNATDLLPTGRKILAELGVTAHELGRPRLQAALRSRGIPCGDKKATALLDLLRQETNP